jgi:glucose/arabinose dehydrogenase
MVVLRPSPRASLAAILLATLLTAACGGDDPPTPPATPTPPPGESPSAAAATPSLTVASPPPESPVVRLQPVAGGFERPVYVTDAGDGSGRLFVVEKRGIIRVVEGGEVAAEPFLDITSLVTSDGNEQGLLGLAFHPRYPEDPRLYVAYTAKDDGANTLAEFRVSDDPAHADQGSRRVLLAIPDSRPNHNGGMVAFGPDGYLYFGTGDGGGGGDPDRTAQDLGSLLGKILRLDVSAGDPYAIPDDNPFAGTAGARPEIWAYGLRNPWRWSFDRATGDLFIADVGQNDFEEVDFEPAGGGGGVNYGWSVMEGSHCFRPPEGCNQAGLTLPIYDFGRDDGCSVTGGYVYRGSEFPALEGRYFFTDYCGGWLRALLPDGEGAWAVEDVGTTNGGVSSFGEDEAGELYLVGDSDGTLYRLVAGE